MAYLDTLTGIGRNEIEEAAMALGKACMDMAFRNSDLGDLIPNRALTATEIRDQFLINVETQVDRFWSKADDGELYAFIEKAAKSVLPERKPTPIPSAAARAADLKATILDIASAPFMPAQAVEHSAEIININRRGA